MLFPASEMPAAKSFFLGFPFPSSVLGKQAETNRGLERLEDVTSWPSVRTFQFTLESPGHGGRTICLFGAGLPRI